MACTTPTPAATKPYVHLEAVDTYLYHLSHLCDFINAISSAQPGHFTDGIRFETIAVVFGFMGEQLKEARDEMESACAALNEKKEAP